MATKKEDRRVERTRAALLLGFRSLVLERRYDQIRVADIVDGANVGRSTFYEHYTDKEAILVDSIKGPFAVLWTVVSDDCDLERLRATLEHFRTNGARARFIFSGAARRPVARALARLMEQRLEARAAKQGRVKAIPVRLAAMGIADALLALDARRRSVRCSGAREGAPRNGERIRRRVVWRSPHRTSLRSLPSLATSGGCTSSAR